MKRYEVLNKGGKAHIKIVGGISWWRNNSSDFTREIDNLLKAGIEDVEGYINSPGGDMMEANEIGNQILRFPGAKHCKLGAICASAGTLLSTYFDTVEAASNTQYMIHDPSVQPIIQHEHDFESNKQLYLNLRNNAIDRYKGKTGLKTEEISDMMLKTTWMNSETAKKKGFIDNISKEKDSLPEDTKSALNEYKFLNVPEVLNEELNFKPIRMSKVTKKLGVSDDATEEEQLAAIAKIENAAKSGAKVLVAMAVAKGFKKETFEKLVNADMEAAMELLEQTPANTTTPPATGAANASGEQAPPDNTRLSDVLNEIKSHLGGGKTTTPAMTFSEYLEKDLKGLKALFQKEPAKVQQLFKEEHGKDVSVNDLKAIL